MAESKVVLVPDGLDGERVDAAVKDAVLTVEEYEELVKVDTFGELTRILGSESGVALDAPLEKHLRQQRNGARRLLREAKESGQTQGVAERIRREFPGALNNELIAKQVEELE